MKDLLDGLANEVKQIALETAALMAEIHHKASVRSEFDQGYNAAVTEIAARIRKLNEAR